MSLEKAVHYLIYNKDKNKPTESISDNRWRAMVAQIVRESERDKNYPMNCSRFWK